MSTARAKKILEKTPEIKTLYGPDAQTAFSSTCVAVAYLTLAVFAPGSFWLRMTLAYVFGATATQHLFLAIHELSHNLVFKTSEKNKLFSIVLNLPLVFPFAIVFRRYHQLHHSFQGEALDFDLPSELEIGLFRGVLGKFVWLSFQLVFYALRPCCIYPIAPCRYAVLNTVLQLCFNALFVHSFGVEPLKFMLASLFFAGGLHPCAGHFLSEHVQFERTTQDTFSYYGGLNRLTLNVGFHNEHHDFPRVSGRRLPLVRALASDSYDELLTRDSWSRTLVRFVLDQNVTLGTCRRRHVGPKTQRSGDAGDGRVRDARL